MQHIFIAADAGRGGIELFSMLGLGLLFILILVLVLFLAVSVSVWVVVRRARRSGAVKRGQEGMEKALQGGLLKVRARGAQGVGRELAQKRLRLRAALDSTTRAVELFRDQQRPVGEIPAIMGTLTRAGAALDSQLRLAEREPDESSRRAAAAAFEPQLAQIERAARDVRSTLTDAAIALGTDDLDNDVRARLATESQVLQAWTQSYSSSGHFPAEPPAGVTSQSTRTVVCGHDWPHTVAVRGHTDGS
ncbi:hypothetical protein [Paenarthrobacter nicotinovorans]|uniref:hypothetical protein n=1 Tax=Paenarthrobacter nicotinovorans TaxID=29320 RepID=UPI0011AA4D3F|nr:hypothetical protein [Paenarthrobacter nicotinovorans]